MFSVAIAGKLLGNHRRKSKPERNAVCGHRMAPKSNCSGNNTMKAYKGHACKVTHILDLGTRWRLVLELVPSLQGA
jgi:hypothetical protein